jgi:hypothetical protein
MATSIPGAISPNFLTPDTSSDAATAGLVAPAVVGNMSVPDVPLPDATVTTPAQQFDKALAKGDSQSMLDVAKNTFGTPVSDAAVLAAKAIKSGDEKFAQVTQPITDAGGIGTPKGNIAVSKAMTLHKDDPLVGEALVQWLSGNGKYARDLLTGGKITSEVKPDMNGKLVQVYTNALGKVVRAHDINSEVDMPADEYQNRAVGRSTYENTIAYKTAAQSAEFNQKEFQEGLKNTQNIGVTTQVIADLSSRLQAELEPLKNLDIDPKQQANLNKWLTSNLSQGNTTNQSKTIMDQIIAGGSANIGKSLTESEKIGLGLPVKGTFTWGKDGVAGTTADQGRTYNQLRSGTTTGSSGEELNKSFANDRASFAAYLKSSGLSAENQLHYLNAMDLSKQIGATQADMVANYKRPSFLPLPNASTSDEPYALTQAKAVQNIAGADLMKAYQKYVNEYQTAHPTYTINPGELEAGFARTSEYKRIIKDAKDASNAFITAPRTFKTVPADVAEPVAPPAAPAKASKNAPAGSNVPPVKKSSGFKDLSKF